MSNDLAVSPTTQIHQAVARYNMMTEFVKTIMVENKDYGKVPGSEKPTLLKPGAEKLSSLFELYPVFRAADKMLDWERDLFFYQYECSLVNRHTGEIWGTGLGSCNSRESKYQYRKGERTCPKCGKAAIIKGREEYGGGWICFAKKGGCGAKFVAGDQAIESQQTGRIINPDIPDLVNTIDKMAQKRALVAATLIACNASEFFTQDIEDMGYAGDYIEGEYKNIPTQPKAEQPKTEPVKTEQTAESNNQDIPQALAHLMGICSDDGTPYPLIPTKDLAYRLNSHLKALKDNGLSPDEKREREAKRDAAKYIIDWRNANPTA